MNSWEIKVPINLSKNFLHKINYNNVNYINYTKSFNVIKEGKIRSNDFIEYIRQIFKYMKSNVNIEKEKLDSYFIIELCILSKKQYKLKKKLQFTFILFLLIFQNWHHLNIYTETRSFEQIRSNSNKFK